MAAVAVVTVGAILSVVFWVLTSEYWSRVLELQTK